MTLLNRTTRRITPWSTAWSVIMRATARRPLAIGSARFGMALLATGLWSSAQPTTTHAQSLSQSLQQQAQCELQYTTDTRSRVAVDLVRSACNDLATRTGPLNERNRRYDICLLQHLAGSQSNIAAAQIAQACRTANPLF